MSENNSIILECKNLKKSFNLKNKKINVLNGINLCIKRGEVYVIIGKSGAGKSTLLSLLGGLERQTEGSIFFKGQDYLSMSNEKLAFLRGKEISIICQNYNLIPSWSAFKNVEASLINTNMKREERIDKVKSLLSNLGLVERLENMPSELSAGEQQRVAFARTLAIEPEMIIADEPTGGVDPITAQEILQILFKVLKNNDVSLMVVTNGEFLAHIIINKLKLGKEILKLIQNVYSIKDGVLHFIGTLDEVVEQNFFEGGFYEKYI